MSRSVRMRKPFILVKGQGSQIVLPEGGVEGSSRRSGDLQGFPDHCPLPGVPTLTLASQACGFTGLEHSMMGHRHTVHLLTHRQSPLYCAPLPGLPIIRRGDNSSQLPNKLRQSLVPTYLPQGTMTLE